MKKAKKIILLALIFLTLTVVGVSARGLRLGLEFGNPNAVIIIRPEPFDFKIGYNLFNLGSGKEYLFLSGDFRIINAYHLIDFLHLFLGAGAYTQIYFGSDPSLDFGARLPLGLQAFLLSSTIELFVEVCPTLLFLPTFKLGGVQGWVGFTLRLK